MDALRAVDPAVADAIAQEQRRQSSTIELIASENFTSAAVMEAAGSVLTNKYAEGYPGKRYYGGCEYVDIVESLARDRARQIFGADHANVQPHSGSQANMAAMLAVLKPGDRIVGMSLQEGGHLTHGFGINFSGRLFDAHFYGVDPKTERIDYDAVRRIAHEVKPHLIIAGASAYPRVIDFARFREIADEVGAVLMADIAHIAGIIAVGLHPTSVGAAQITTTTTHKTLRGPRGGMILCDAEYAEAIDRTVFPGTQGGPLLHIIAGKAVALHEAMQPAFREYIERVLENARVLAETLQAEGFRLVSGGTDNHLMLVDLTEIGISGRKAERLLDAVGITVNKNTIPGDPRPPAQASGIRLGTPAMTTRGFGPDEMRQTGRWIAAVLRAPDDEALADRVRHEVAEMAAHFPVPGLESAAPVAGGG
ncbi:serine hydroxymethyltransferase [Sphaerobacter thermophilus]|uniref:Serine hydroxymethyltransferase n=1 Tax=Sphaerobacter thermophilus (strain ATCC 49802 / DSM 20745 / KCCM 41009 / NCIMB 13125 / S 6022) TaxID=479434 RepID=D1C3A1_SPHTD|nr:serine hydroxymethyltransferase [Sphaerobacter thermophilus]ACZ38718.1 Glycine hydroxymethyltransferase [Sphaerobacter thermophilus DSM 20745]